LLFLEKEKTLKNTKPKPAHRPILVRPRNECGLVTKPAAHAAQILKQQRPRPTFSPPTWAESSPTRRESSILDRRQCVTHGATKPVRRQVPQNSSSLSSFPLLFHEAEREQWPTGQRGGTAREPARRRATFTQG
jgi:hypothetical protein